MNIVNIHAVSKDNVNRQGSGLHSVREARACLSPVRTQRRMPAAARLAMASGTPACSLSSMAVQPSSCSPTSAASATAATASSRPASAVFAPWNRSCHLRHKQGL